VFNRKRKGLGLVLVLFMYLMSLTAPFQSFATLPDEWRMFSGEGRQWNFSLPVSGMVTVNDPDIVRVNGQTDDSFKLELNEPISFESASIGETEMQLKLFGSIPVKKWKVNVVPDLEVIPGGQTIGVKIKSDGILVVGHHLVTAGNNKKVSPGEDAQIMLGDIITKINDKPLSGVSEVGSIVEEAGKSGQPITLTIRRNGKVFVKQLTPAFDAEDQAYRLGLYIRDSAAGVGTLTFYAPDQGVYGALGHVITDMDTQTAIPVGDGKIVHSTVTSISKSHNGVPGEKRAHFFKENKILGNIERNTDFGIFGKMAEQPNYGYTQEPVPVAFAEEVREGPAQILTVVDGHKVEAFDIEVVHTASQSAPATKGLVIKITDQRLLDRTGGIVQGMSGSPILQNGKLIGAVTHVFVNDPSSGYGCFIEWMLQDAGVMIQPQQELQAG